MVEGDINEDEATAATSIISVKVSYEDLAKINRMLFRLLDIFFNSATDVSLDSMRNIARSCGRLRKSAKNSGRRRLEEDVTTTMKKLGDVALKNKLLDDPTCIESDSLTSCYEDKSSADIVKNGASVTVTGP
jgi:hypothetical protein